MYNREIIDVILAEHSELAKIHIAFQKVKVPNRIQQLLYN